MVLKTLNFLGEKNDKSYLSIYLLIYLATDIYIYATVLYNVFWRAWLTLKIGLLFLKMLKKYKKNAT